MKKNVLITTILVFFPLCFTQLMAQVTIGALSKPDSSAVLDLQSNNSRGLLLPRVGLIKTSESTPLLNHVAGMAVYNTASQNDVTPGYYYDDGERWVRIMNTESSIRSLQDQWFFLPSFNLPLSNGMGSTTGLTYDLYQEYVNQFTGVVSVANPNIEFHAGDGSAPPVVAPYTRDQLVFYVTAYSKDIIKVVSVTNGVLTYDILSGVVPDGSYLNVIFKVKSN